MRVSEPRVAPLEQDQWSAAAREAMKPFLGQDRIFNIFKTMTNHPDLMRRWMVFANHILGKSTLAVRERELVILRIGYLCQSGYEWGQHVLIAQAAGMSLEEIRSAKTGPSTPGITELDALLLRATDELHGDSHVSDETWAGLSELLSTQQLMDLVFTVGQYNLVSMALNSFGVQLDEGLPGWDV
jgi:alkylhydroperoxidase family enzyme